MPFAAITATTGTTAVLPAPTPPTGYSAFYRILGLQVIGNAAGVVATFKDGASTVLMNVPCPSSGTGGICCPPVPNNGEPYFYTSPGNAFNVTLSGTGTVYCTVQYTLFQYPSVN